MSNKNADVTLETLYKIFTVPESENSTLGKIEKEISQNLHGFLNAHIVSLDTQPDDLEKEFADFKIPDNPIYVSDQANFLLSKVVSQSVHTASPSFVGHMTSALPYFMLPLAKMMIALNQNLVKIETSKAFTPLERQVLGMLHHLVYKKPDAYYQKFIQDYEVALGAFCSNGTIANVTSMWVALNKALPKSPGFDGVSEEGLFAGLQHHGYQGAAILVSKRGHYSLQKAANLLGIGKRNLIAIPTDNESKIRTDLLKQKIKELQEKNIAIISVVGIAGTTETGNIDDLRSLATICNQENIHFHVDAAWGGPTLFSKKYGHLLDGIESADSVTFDAHKQLYVPMGAGFALFKNENDLSLIEHTAEYIIRKGSRDIGRRTLEGSRPGMAMLVHSGFKIIGCLGYEMLIDMGIEKAKTFSQLIMESDDFELVSHPELNILTYRYIPQHIKERMKNATKNELNTLNERLNQLTINIQKHQREKGKTFVSRTTLQPKCYGGQNINVFRVVLANPLTQVNHLEEILDEQRAIANIVASDFSEI